MKIRRRLPDGGGLPLTPLIDVMFQVLLYYMLTSSVAINPALRIDLPEAYTSMAAVEDEIVVTIGPTGAISVGARIVAEDQFVQAVREAAAVGARKSLLLLGDASIPYRTLVSVMDKARVAGIETVSLGTLKSSVPPR
jgi:biopolymer transport protein ExbD